MDTITTPPVLNRKWYELWLEVWRHPGVDAFKSILNERDHEAMQGFIWIGVASLIAGFLAGINTYPLIRNLMPNPSGGDIFFYACGVVLTPIFAIIGMIISAGIYHLIAKIFRGSGQWGDLVFCFSAVAAPFTIITGVLSFINFIFYRVSILSTIISIAIGIFSLILLIFIIVLYINAIRAVENIGTGQAVLTYFIPVLIVLLLAVCLILTLIPVYQMTQ